MAVERIRSSVVSVSWIPSEAIAGLAELPFSRGVAHYDDPPPDVLDDPFALVEHDRCRFVNVLSAWADVEDGRVVGFGQEGRGIIGSTTLRLGSGLTFAGVPFPDIHHEPEASGDQVRFVQTAGGHTGVPAPRRVRRPPFVKIVAPTAWTTLALTIRADGTSTGELVGASHFPRHWIYDADHHLMAKSGVIDFGQWYRESFGETTPWGDEDSPAIVTLVETALERELSLRIMRGGAQPDIKRLEPNDVLVRQGEEGTELFLLLDGVVVVDVDGKQLAELGPGAVFGERAVLEGGRRTSTVTAVTNAKVAVVPADRIDAAALDELRQGHRREEQS